MYRFFNRIYYTKYSEHKAYQQVNKPDNSHNILKLHDFLLKK